MVFKKTSTLLNQLFRIIPLNIGLDQRGVRQRTVPVLHIPVRVVVQKHHGLCLRYHTDGSDQLLYLILQHPLVAGQINLLAGLDLFQQLRARKTLAVAQTTAETAAGALQVLHVLLPEQLLVYTDTLKHLQPLPDTFH